MEKRIIGLLVFALILTGVISCGDSNRKSKSDKAKTSIPDFQTSDIETNSSVQEGQKLFVQYCSVCHGKDGKKGLNGAKDLTRTNKGVGKIIKRIREGKGNMPGFKTILNDQQIMDIAKYVGSLKTK